MSKTSAIVFFSIVGVGAVISVITLNLLGDKEEVKDPEPKKLLTVEEEEPLEPLPEEEKKPKAKEETAKADAPAKPKEEPKPAESKPAGFDSPEAAMKALAEKVEAKDFKGFEEVAGKKAIPEAIRNDIKAIVENPELKIDEKKPFREISKSADSVRWALNIEGGEGAASELFADLAKNDTKKIDIAKLSLPIDPTTTTRSVSPGESPAETPDPLSIALAFSEAIVDRKFETARSLADPSTVTDERLAALMIALEEGGFQLREDRPLVVTLSRDDITWVLTRVQSGQEGSEFAVELGKVDEDWKVNGLTFSKVISLLADKSGAGDIAYSPIVEDPEGGDSLVLYFEFDQAGVTPRASRQLAIVADILSKGNERVIRINGHADALGTDAYNKSLSNGRAGSIRQALISMGVSPDQIITESFGETKPRSPNFNPDGTDNPTGRSKNRRAEVYLDF